MSKVTAVLDQIEAEQLRQQIEQIPDNISLPSKLSGAR
jgi:hypothetical protein